MNEVTSDLHNFSWKKNAFHTITRMNEWNKYMENVHLIYFHGNVECRIFVVLKSSNITNLTTMVWIPFIWYNSISTINYIICIISL